MAVPVRDPWGRSEWGSRTAGSRGGRRGLLDLAVRFEVAEPVAATLATSIRQFFKRSSKMQSHCILDDA